MINCPWNLIVSTLSEVQYFVSSQVLGALPFKRSFCSWIIYRVLAWKLSFASVNLSFLSSVISCQSKYSSNEAIQSTEKVFGSILLVKSATLSQTFSVMSLELSDVLCSSIARRFSKTVLFACRASRFWLPSCAIEFSSFCSLFLCVSSYPLVGFLVDNHWNCSSMESMPSATLRSWSL